MDKNKFLSKQRRRRRFRVRKRFRGTPECPRLTVYRSNQNLSCQLIDDTTGRTLISASTMDKGLRDEIKYGGNCDAASIVGKAVAEKALEKGIQEVCFDRGSYKFHGRVAALAHAAREAGLKF